MQYQIEPFKDIVTFRRWMQERRSKMRPHNSSEFEDRLTEHTLRKLKSDGVLGSKTTLEEMRKPLHTFMDHELLKRVVSELGDKIVGKMSAGAKSLFERPKLQFNDQGLGNFSFERAAMGLYKLKDYFFLETGEMLDRNEYANVIMEMNGTEEEYWWRTGPELYKVEEPVPGHPDKKVEYFHFKANDERIAESQIQYVVEMEVKLEKKWFLIKREHYVRLVQKDRFLKNEDGSVKTAPNPSTGAEEPLPAIATSTTKIFAYFPQRTGPRDTIEINLLAGNNYGVSGDQMLYSSVVGIHIAKLMYKLKFGVKINVSIGSESGGYMRCSQIPVKDFSEKIDNNLLALLSSDPRLFRTEGFQAIIATYDNFGQDAPSGYGRLPDVDAYEAELNRLRVLEVAKKRKEKPEKVQIRKELYVFGNITSLDQAKRQFYDKLMQIIYYYDLCPGKGANPNLSFTSSAKGSKTYNTGKACMTYTELFG